MKHAQGPRSGLAAQEGRPTMRAIRTLGLGAFLGMSAYIIIALFASIAGFAIDYDLSPLLFGLTSFGMGLYGSAVLWGER